MTSIERSSCKEYTSLVSTVYRSRVKKNPVSDFTVLQKSFLFQGQGHEVKSHDLILKV